MIPITTQVEPADIKDITFSAKQSLRPSRNVDSPTESELGGFFEALNESKEKPAILKISPPYHKQFVHDKSLPSPISQLYDPDTLALAYLPLLAKCEEVTRTLKVLYYIFGQWLIGGHLCLQVNLEQVVLLEKSTRGQACNKSWFQQREGRITASNFKAVVRTDPSMPAMSLIKRICYSEAFKFTSESTR